MQIRLSHPERTIEVQGPKRAKDLLRELSLVVEAHLVIRRNELVTEDEMLSDKDEVEIRPVISGGSAETTSVVMGHSSINGRPGWLPTTNDERQLPSDDAVNP